MRDGGQRTARVRRGALVAALMAAAVTGRNRRSCAVPEIATVLEDDDIVDIQQLLLCSGAGPLAWWAVRDTPLGHVDSAAGLRDSYLIQAVRAVLAERELEHLVSVANDAGIDAILGKGWSVARSYPDPSLRPYGDFDLYVAPADYERFSHTVAANSLHGFGVDLHRGGSYLDDRNFPQLLQRSVWVPLGSTQVRTFGPEDHLRLVCLHMLAEGVIRPPWLCDVGFMIQSAHSSFDWDLFRSGDRRRTDWAFAAIGLAHQVIDVDISTVPDARHVRSQPRWLAQTVVRVWGDGPLAKGARVPMAEFRRTGRRARHLLVERWPNPIEATIGVKGGINAIPRLPYQLADCARRMGTLGNISRLVQNVIRGSLAHDSSVQPL